MGTAAKASSLFHHILYHNKKGKHKQTKIIWQNLLKWNSIFFTRSDLTTDDHLHNWKRWTSSSSSALLGQHLSPFLVRVDDAMTKGRVALPNRMNFRKKIQMAYDHYPPPHFRKIMLQIFYDRYGCICVRRYDDWIVWNLCTWFPIIGVIQL